MRNGRVAQIIGGSARTTPVLVPCSWHPVLTTLLLCVILLGLASCASMDRLPAVPLALASKTKPLDIPDARFYAVGDTDRLVAFAEKVYVRRSRAGLAAKPSSILAISGGGDDGAFGGGLLIGWSERGDRPEFATVTGISTGALSAPFAFLGSEYDSALKEIYTNVGDATGHQGAETELEPRDVDTADQQSEQLVPGRQKTHGRRKQERKSGSVLTSKPEHSGRGNGDARS